MEKKIKIGKRFIGDQYPTYFVADIGANHDGDLSRAKHLIHLAREAGADAAKFQNFKASKIVSDFGFKTLGLQQSHQAKWKKSVFETYADASISSDWTPELKSECDKVGIDYFSSPYDFESVDQLDPYVDLYKIGSGDITWIEMLQFIAKKGKPLLLATGAATIGDVQRAVDAILSVNPSLILMQCNTSYTGHESNYDFVNLRVLQTYANIYPDLVLGLSDHTTGLSTTLGAVALGARVIEKHFTDENSRPGPDHAFAMNPKDWREMVCRTRELERALGTGNKRVENNELETVILQQRAIRAARDIQPGELLKNTDLDVLRPAPSDCIKPYDISRVIDSVARVAIKAGDIVRWKDLA